MDIQTLVRLGIISARDAEKWEAMARERETLAELAHEVSAVVEKYGFTLSAVTVTALGVDYTIAIGENGVEINNMPARGTNGRRKKEHPTTSYFPPELVDELRAESERRGVKWFGARNAMRTSWGAKIAEKYGY